LLTSVVLWCRRVTLFAASECQRGPSLNSRVSRYPSRVHNVLGRSRQNPFGQTSGRCKTNLKRACCRGVSSASGVVCQIGQGLKAPDFAEIIARLCVYLCCAGYASDMYICWQTCGPVLRKSSARALIQDSNLAHVHNWKQERKEDLGQKVSDLGATNTRHCHHLQDFLHRI